MMNCVTMRLNAILRLSKYRFNIQIKTWSPSYSQQWNQAVRLFAFAVLVLILLTHHFFLLLANIILILKQLLLETFKSIATINLSYLIFGRNSVYPINQSLFQSSFYSSNDLTYKSISQRKFIYASMFNASVTNGPSTTMFEQHTIHFNQTVFMRLTLLKW